MYLAPIRLPHWRMYLALIMHITAFEYLATITEFGYCFLVNDVMDQGLCTENDTDHKFWANFDKCYGLRPSREPRRLRSRFIGI